MVLNVGGGLGGLGGTEGRADVKFRLLRAEGELVTFRMVRNDAQGERAG